MGASEERLTFGRLTVAIDPGKHYCACALMGHAELLAVQYVRSFTVPGLRVSESDLRFKQVSVILETPVFYPKAKSNDANDLISISVAGGWMANACAPGIVPRQVHPSTWKGQVPKYIHHERIRAKLLTGEMRIMIEALAGVSPLEQHNLWDAVGLGLWSIGRMRPDAI